MANIIFHTYIRVGQDNNKPGTFNGKKILRGLWVLE